MKKDLTEKNINLLISGKHPQTKKFAGKNVMVIENEVVPMTTKRQIDRDVNRIIKAHGKAPTLVFVPKPGVSYIFYF